MRRRLSFPLTAENGTLQRVEGETATFQSLLMYPRTAPGSHVLARQVGMHLEYNVTVDGAQIAAFELQNQVDLFEPPGVSIDITSSFNLDDRHFEALVNWADRPVLVIRP